MDAFGYLVSDLSSAAKRASGTGVRNKAPEPDGAQEPAAAAAPQEPAGAPRRRRAKATRVDRGYEYADLDDALQDTAAPGRPLAAVLASDQSAGTSAFAGIAHKQGAPPAAGLITRTAEAFDSPRVPMM
ncbi:PPW family C-terminal domain-containing PPE protein, partial [Mycobacterium simiae]